MRMIATDHFPKAKVGDIVGMEGATYRVAGSNEGVLTLLFTAKGKAKHDYQAAESRKLTEEEINTEENKRELLAEMDFEEAED